jgi:hypothetical protein
MKASNIQSLLALWIFFVVVFGLILGLKPMDSSSVEYRTISFLLAVSAILFLGTAVGAYMIVPLVSGGFDTRNVPPKVKTSRCCVVGDDVLKTSVENFLEQDA